MPAPAPSPLISPTLLLILERLNSEEERKTALEQQLATLASQTAALSASAVDRRRELREGYIALHEKRFHDVDAKKALIGVPTEHLVEIADTVRFWITPPKSGAPVPTGAAPDEAYLSQWLIGVQLLGREVSRVDLRPLTPEARVEKLRTLPGVLVKRLAEECSTLEGWLAAVLEVHLGNF